jgi:hypothetical protein
VPALQGSCSRNAVVEPGMSDADALRHVRGRASNAATQPIHPGRFVVRDEANPSIARARAVAKLRRLLKGLAACQHRGAFADRLSAAHARANPRLPLAPYGQDPDGHRGAFTGGSSVAPACAVRGSEHHHLSDHRESLTLGIPEVKTR